MALLLLLLAITDCWILRLSTRQLFHLRGGDGILSISIISINVCSITNLLLVYGFNALYRLYFYVCVLCICVSICVFILSGCIYSEKNKLYITTFSRYRTLIGSHTLRVDWYDGVLLRWPEVPEIVFWYRLTSALDDAAITSIRVLLFPTYYTAESTPSTGGSRMLPGKSWGSDFFLVANCKDYRCARNLVGWFSAKSLKLLPPDVIF